MKNNIEININSLFCKSVINLIYLMIECLLLFLICYLINHNQIMYAYFLPIVILGEMFRRNILFNTNISNKIYRIIYLLKTEPNILVHVFDKLLIFTFVLFFALNIINTIYNPTDLSQNQNSMFAIVNTVITVSAIVLPLLFAALQQFENKYSDFGSIIEKWKQTNIRLFVFLAFYTTLSFIFLYSDTNININNLILCASIYMILKLILIAINVSLLMGFKLVIVDYKNDIIKWIKSWKIEKSSLDKNFDLNKMMNNLLKRGIVNFIRYKIWGLNRKTHFSIADGTIDEIKIKIEPIFRIAEIFIKENNLNNFKCAMDAIYEILVQYNNVSKTHLETNILNYAAAKIKDLFKLAIKLNYQSFPEHIVNINEKLGLLSINEKTITTSFHTIQTTNSSAFIQNSCDFVILSLSLENTPAPTQAISSLRKFASKLIYNNSITESAVILDKLQNLAEQIYILNNKNIITNSLWCMRQIIYVLVDIINIIYCLIFYELSEPNSLNTEYMLDNSIQAFKKTYKILTNYKALSCDFTNMFTNLGTDTKLQMVTKLLSKNPYIKTPYYNSQVHGNRLVTDFVNSISQIFNAIFVFDLNETYNFVHIFNKLDKVLNLYLYAVKRLIETKNDIDIQAIILSLLEIQDYFILFIHRLQETKFTQQFLEEALNNFIRSYYDNMMDILSSCIQQEQWYSYSLESAAKLVSNTLDFYYDGEKYYQDLIFEFIKKLIELYNDITDDYTSKEYFKFINLLTLISCENNAESKISKILLKFVKDNMPTKKSTIQFDFDGTEQNNLPSYSSHLGIDYYIVNKYANFLTEIFKSKNEE